MNKKLIQQLKNLFQVLGAITIISQLFYCALFISLNFATFIGVCTIIWLYVLMNLEVDKNGM